MRATRTLTVAAPETTVAEIIETLRPTEAEMTEYAAIAAEAVADGPEDSIDPGVYRRHSSKDGVTKSGTRAGIAHYIVAEDGTMSYVNRRLEVSETTLAEYRKASAKGLYLRDA
jgi:hypothetical protein